MFFCVNLIIGFCEGVFMLGGIVVLREIFGFFRVMRVVFVFVVLFIWDESFILLSLVFS